MFLTSALDEGEWSNSRPGRFTPEEKALGTPSVGGLVRSRADLNAVAERKSTCSCPELNPGRLAGGSVTILTELLRLQAIVLE
jgi:hypothetical protein